MNAPKTSPRATPPVVTAPVTVIPPANPPKVGDTNTAPTTTAEQDMVTAGQRVINLIWESTQQKVALGVIGAALIVSVSLSVFGKYLGTPDMQLAALVFLFGVANLVTGFYFGRTNHQRTGGVGPKLDDSR